MKKLAICLSVVFLLQLLSSVALAEDHPDPIKPKGKPVEIKHILHDLV